MTREQNLEVVRKACVAANPEIVELKFGCFIEWKDGHIKTDPIAGVQPMSDGMWEMPWGCFHPQLNVSEYNVIGRPIRLADILLVGEDKFWGREVLEIVAKWNLHTDDLTLQSDECLQFLADLLTPPITDKTTDL